MPENIEVSVEHLAEIGEQITVADLKAPVDVAILTDPAQTVAKVAEPVVEEPEPEAAEEGAVAEGEEPAEGETKPEGEGQQTEGSESEKPAEEKKEE